VTRIACAQIAPAVGQLQANLELSAAAIAEAVAAGAQIVVLSELVTTPTSADPTPTPPAA
jgi:predicted amidohydrolase